MKKKRMRKMRKRMKMRGMPISLKRKKM